MKKVVVTLFAAVMFLFGCSGGKETITKCSLTSSINVEQTITSKGDKVLKQELDQKFQWKTRFASEEQLQKTLDEFKQKYAIDGVTYETSIDGDTLNEKITVDFEKADFEKLQEVGLLAKSSQKITSISLEQTVTSLEKAGATCSKPE